MKLFQFTMISILTFCGFSASANESFLEKIIGENDLIAVNADGSNIPDRYRSILNAFGEISMGCTATHIGGGYVLSAGHCFDAPDVVVRNQPCSDITVKWGVREGTTPYLTSQCESIVAMQLSEGNDFAVFKVTEVPTATVGVDTEKRAQDGEALTIFSHPDLMPLRWSQSSVVEAVKHPFLPADAIHHKCDTNPGSSGATILNLETLKVIGIHDGGLMSDGGMNYGTYIMNSEVLDVLKELGF